MAANGLKGSVRARRFVPGESFTLASLATRLSLAFRPSHHAMDDVLTTCELLVPRSSGGEGCRLVTQADSAPPGNGWRWPLVSLSQLGDTFLALLAGRTLQLTKMEHPLITLARLAEKAYIEGWTISFEEYAAKNGIDLDALRDSDTE
ncbi:MAG: hypothetical protein IMX01_06180 [Limnochordaceae bacterium]|nr:hypothetical protein [Limnochordaceae bacterium]